jgi:hypothetical protein
MSAKDRAIEMRKFLNEYQYSCGPRSLVELPDPTQFKHYKTVVIPLEQVVKFRNDYNLLLGFACLMCGKEYSELCGMDLLAPFILALRDEEEEEE